MIYLKWTMKMKKNLLRILSIFLSVVIVISIVVIRRDKPVDGNLEVTDETLESTTREITQNSTTESTTEITTETTTETTTEAASVYYETPDTVTPKALQELVDRVADRKSVV